MDLKETYPQKDDLREWLLFAHALVLAEINHHHWFSLEMARVMKNAFFEKERGYLLYHLKYLSDFQSRIFSDDYFGAVSRCLENEDCQEHYIETVKKSPEGVRVSLDEETARPKLLLDQREVQLYPIFVLENENLWVLRELRDGQLYYSSQGREKRINRRELREDLGDFFMNILALGEAEEILGSTRVKPLREGWEAYKRGKIDLAFSLLLFAQHTEKPLPVVLYLLSKISRIRENRGDLETYARKMVELYPKLDRSYEAMVLYAELSGGERTLRLSVEEGLRRNPKNRYLRRKKKEIGRKEKEKNQEGETFLLLMNGMDYEKAIGRENEIRQLLEILSCHYKNNALIVGEEGVGKTSLVEEFVRRIDSGEVPPEFEGRRVYKLSFARSIAGTKFRGQFEERILSVLEKVKENEGILFLDDIHFLISPSFSKGAGMDIAGVLLPEMEKGSFQIIATTTPASLSDLRDTAPAFIRRFHILRLQEIEPGLMEKILEKKKEKVEAHHDVILPRRLLKNIMELAQIYLPEKKLPEMGIDIMDRAASKAAVGFSREEREVPEVTLGDLQKVVAEMSGLREEEIKTSSREAVKDLEKKLRTEIIGQDEAIEKIARVIKTAKLGLDVDSRRPDGVLLFVGPTGVGKTETARALSRILYGNEKRLIRIDMSQMMEKHFYSSLVGAPPGYVGYYDQNQLTDRIIAQPNSIILLDEVEKAHVQVLNIFLQVFDAGRLTDGRGRTAYFNHATVIMTSNIGTDLYFRSKIGFEWTKVVRSEIMQEVRRFFTPEFLNRIDEIVFFKPLELEDVKKIVELQLRDVRRRLRLEGKSLILTEKAKELLASRGYSKEYGARLLARTIRELLLDKIALLKLSSQWDNYKTLVADARNDEILILPSHEPSLEETFLEEEKAQGI